MITNSRPTISNFCYYITLHNRRNSNLCCAPITFLVYNTVIVSLKNIFQIECFIESNSDFFTNIFIINIVNIIIPTKVSIEQHHIFLCFISCLRAQIRSDECCPRLWFIESKNCFTSRDSAII